MNKNIPQTKSMHPQTPFQVVGEAIYLMELAFRLQRGFHDELINEACFTKGIIIDTTQGFGFKERELDENALTPRFHNLVISTIGTLAIIFDGALDKKYGDKEPLETDTINSLRAFFYMLRCAYAHGAINLKWQAMPKYQRIYKITIPSDALQKLKHLNPKTEYVFDFKKLNRQIIELDSFDRFNGLMCLALYAAHLTEPI